MRIDSASLIYFSPTHTTKKVLEAISRGVGTSALRHIDLTPPASRTRRLPPLDEELAIIGAPVYSGRIPLEAAIRIRRLHGNATPAVVVVLYGNREYEDALLELRDIAIGAGFVPIAGGAFVGEHSYDSPETPIATGRPDTSDLEKAEQFGVAIEQVVRALEPLAPMPRLQVPGNDPFRERSSRARCTPETLDDLCTRCALCVAACPMAAIDVGDPLTTDQNLCIFCSACVKVCPTSARVWEHAETRRIAKWLAENCSVRKEPETYL